MEKELHNIVLYMPSDKKKNIKNILVLVLGFSVLCKFKNNTEISRNINDNVIISPNCYA